MIQYKAKRKLINFSASLALYLPKDVINLLGMTDTREVYLTVDNGRLIVEPVTDDGE